jgi:hypothetical protein
MASHRQEELRKAGRTLAQAARAAGFEPRTHSARAADTTYELEEQRPAEPTPVAAEADPLAGVFDFEDDSSIARAA